MPPEDSAGKWALEKPLNELTEDDIAQLTREDCRRYLKEKGMRRPSWNKSQAIQQVIMLKALLEATLDSDAGSYRRRRISRRRDDNQSGASNSAHLDPKGTSSDAENSAETTKDLDKPDCRGGFSGRLATTAGDESAHIRPTDSTDTSAGQMTILYCGKINVYDDVPAHKAQAILHIAAGTVQFPEGQSVDGAKTPQHLPCTSMALCTKPHQDSVALVLPTLQTVKMSDNPVGPGEEVHVLYDENPGEGASARKASVQRYLEKKNNRFKSKRKAEATSCASLDVYFNYQMPNRSTFSPPRIRPSSTPAGQ